MRRVQLTLESLYTIIAPARLAACALAAACACGPARLPAALRGCLRLRGSLRLCGCLRRHAPYDHQVTLLSADASCCLG